MKDKNTLRSNLFATLWELQNNKPHHDLKCYLQGKLATLYDVLEDEIEQEWWEQIENAIEAEGDFLEQIKLEGNKHMIAFQVYSFLIAQDELFLKFADNEVSEICILIQEVMKIKGVGFQTYSDDITLIEKFLEEYDIVERFKDDTIFSWCKSQLKEG